MAYATIDKGSKYFNTVTWTGTGSAMSITGVGFKPDWVWYKGRSFGYNHGLFDAVRGTTNFLKSNSTDAEAVVSGVTAFNSDGFSLGTDAGGVGSGNTFVAWNWLGANTTVSNTSGSITSTVSANTTSGFSIVSYTGTGANATVGHGLGVAPKWVITNNRTAGSNWRTFTSTTGNTQNMKLNLTEAGSTDTSFWNSTSPTSSVFSLGTNSEVNGSGNSMIAYCFADVKAFSKFGSFVGNGSATDGAFVYLGFKPSFVMLKASSTGGSGYNWGMWDNKRIGYNPDNNDLRANTATAESTDDSIDLLSNGFKMRTDSGGFGGGSGVTYIYMAFAENPFVSSKGLPCTAR